MIIVDGSRSLKRKWFGDKQLRTLEDNGLETKTVVLDGFTIKASILDDMKKIKIDAPMGVIALCSKDNEIIACFSEYWLSGFAPARPVFARDTSVPSGFAQEMVSTPPNEYSTTKVVPVFVANKSNSRPVAIPLGVGEVYFLSMSVARSSGSLIAESCVEFYGSDGSQNVRTSISMEADSAFLPRQTIQLLPAKMLRAIRTNCSTMFNVYGTLDVVLASVWMMEELSSIDTRF